jgi:hypothetical protein
MTDRYLALCSALVVLVAAVGAAQDTTCENFEVDTQACNDSPYNSCSTRTQLSNIIVGDLGDGCNHIETEPLTCPGGSSCPGTQYFSVSVPNPYCTQFCGCGAECTCCNGGAVCGYRQFCVDDCTCQYASPIIVDTTGGGFQFTAANDGVLFDIAGDAHPIKMAWTAAGSHDAFLALDRNHNGKIDSGKELFGNMTEQPHLPIATVSLRWQSSIKRKTAEMETG